MTLILVAASTSGQKLPEWLEVLRVAYPWVSRFLVDHRFWISLLASAGLLAWTLRYHLGEKNVGEVLLSKQFLSTLVLLALLWSLIYYQLYWPASKALDESFAVSVADFGTDPLAQAFREELSTQTAKYLRSATRTSFFPNALRESIPDLSVAQRLGRARGVHLVVFGKARQAKPGVWAVSATLTQVAWFEDVRLVVHQVDSQGDIENPEDRRRIAKDIAVKILLISDQVDLAAKAGLQVHQFNVFAPLGPNCFTVGSNLASGFRLTEDDPQGAYLQGHFGPDGRPVISGKLYDSDGNQFLEIRDSVPVAPNPLFFEVIRSARTFRILDRYGRELLEVLERDPHIFADEYVKRRQAMPRHPLRPAPPPDEEKLERERLREGLLAHDSFVVINGEFYRSDGSLGLSLDNFSLRQYGIKLFMGEPVPQAGR